MTPESPVPESGHWIVRLAEDHPLDTRLSLAELVKRAVDSGVICDAVQAEERIKRMLDHYGWPKLDRYPSLALANMFANEALGDDDAKGTNLDDARLALAISPDCARAWHLLVKEPSLDLPGRRAMYERAVTAYERLVWLDELKEDVLSGDGRQYIRARAGLALCLWDEGRKADAASILWESLRLNPRDYAHVRGILAGWLPQLHDDAQLGRLVREWPVDMEKPDAKRTYTEVLLYFRLGDYEAARSALSTAVRQNPYVLLAIVSRAEPHDDGPPRVAGSSMEYAASVNSYIGEGWRRTTGAIAWARRCSQEFAMDGV